MFLNPYNPIGIGYSPEPKELMNTERSLRGQAFPQVPLWNVYTVHKPLPGTTSSKAGDSYNIPPSPLPKNMVGYVAPTYSTATGEPIWQDRVGLQLGAFDPYDDSPYASWTYGVQYYTPYRGQNIRQMINPVIAPRAGDTEVWGTTTSSYPQVNRERARQMSELPLSYECRGCAPTNASLGYPIDNVSPETLALGVSAPLQVQLPGAYPVAGEYTGRFIGRSTRDWPQPTNPMVDIQMKKAGLPTPPIQPEYDDRWSQTLKQGFIID